MYKKSPSFSCFTENLSWFQIPLSQIVSNAELTFCPMYVTVTLGVMNLRSGVSSLDNLSTVMGLDIGGKIGGNAGMPLILNLLTFRFLEEIHVAYQYLYEFQASDILFQTYHFLTCWQIPF